MRKQDYEDSINVLLHAQTALDNGFISAELQEAVKDRLIFLNAYIDAMCTQKTERDWIIIGIAYQLYRIKENLP